MCSIANHVLINQRVNGAGEEKTEYLCREIYLSRFISTPRFDFLPRFQRVNNFCPETFPPREIGETYVNTGWPGIHVESTLIREWPLSRPLTGRQQTVHHSARGKIKIIYSKIIARISAIRNIYSIRRRNFFAKNCTIYSDYIYSDMHWEIAIPFWFIIAWVCLFDSNFAYLTNEIGIPSKYLDNCYRNTTHHQIPRAQLIILCTIK